jgi:hypothetical protein
MVSLQELIEQLTTTDQAEGLQRTTKQTLGIDHKLAFNMADQELASSPNDEDRTMKVTVHFTGEKVPFEFHADASLEDLVMACDERWGSEYDWTAAKIIPDRTPGIKPLLKPRTDLEVAIAPLNGKSVRIMASKVADIALLHETEQQSLRHWARRREALHHARASRATPARRSGGNPEDAAYTFLQLRPLPNMPHPERSMAFLQRLKEDPGIRHAMRKHKFSVGLLTEMDPAAYTESTHEGTTRILGLNRNAGEVIELRLRTDAGDGYRAYGVIRKTLCHELAHNVHGPHDSKFWDLCHLIEREVQGADYKSGGRTVGDQDYYQPSEGFEGGGDDDEQHVYDHGGWTGGTFVLGGGSGSGSSASQDSPGLSRREIIARAAEERRKRLLQANEKAKTEDRHPGDGTDEAS